MPFPTPTLDQIRDALLRDIAALLPDANVGKDSDYWIRASSVASAVEGLYQHQQWAAKQILPDTADSEYLERHAALHGMTRKAANQAAGSIEFSGTVGVNIPQGTEARTLGGVSFVTTIAGVIGGGGTVAIAAQAAVAGIAGNQAPGVALTLSAAPFGVLSAAEIVTMTSGTDVESDAQLLVRLLDVLQDPPAGGNAADYKRWALEVAGITSAFVYPLRRGIGTVDTAVLSNGVAPSGPVLAAAQAYIDARRPVGLPAGSTPVLAPTFVPVAITAALTLDGTTLGAVTPLINEALTDYFAALEPGDTVYRNRVLAIIADMPGVADVNLTLPAANAPMLVDATHLQMASMGVVILT